MAGIRDRHLLESAIARPRQKNDYEGTIDFCELAAAYGFGLARNHPFADGKKRTAYVVMTTCLNLHGLQIVAPEDDKYNTMIAMASGELSEDQMATWLKSVTAPLSSSS